MRYRRKRWSPARRTDRSPAHGASVTANAVPSTSPNRRCASSRPASCGATVRNSSSSNPAATRSPMRCGPPSHRTSRAPVDLGHLDEARGRHPAIGPDRLDPHVRPRRDRPESLRTGRCRGDDHRHVRRREPGVGEVEVTARRGDDGRGLRARDAHPGPPGGERLGRSPVHASGRPLVRRRSADGAGTDEHDVRHRPEQAHHEAIGIEEPADLAATRAAIQVECDDAVDGRHEVGDDGRPIGPQGDMQLAVVPVAQVRRKEPAADIRRCVVRG